MEPQPSTKNHNVNIESLSVCYSGKVQALNGVSLSIGPGLFGLLGPNGAGKSTLMRVLTTLQRPTQGAVRVLGFDLIRDAGSIRTSLGYLPQDFQTYPQLTAREALDYYALIGGMSDPAARRRRIDEVLEQVGLSDSRRRKVGKFSGGMRQRVGIAQALLTNAPFLIFDEPTAGLDPKERVHFRNLIGELSQNRIVILSTHIVSDINSACSRLAVLDRGQIRFVGTTQELTRQAEGKIWQIIITEAEYEPFRARYAVTSRREVNGGVEVRFLSEDHQDSAWQSTEPTLEDAYLWLIGGSHDFNR